MIKTEDASPARWEPSKAASQLFPAPRPVTLGPYDTSETLYCPRTMVGRVIGKEGETIKALQEVTGAKIQINQQHESLCIVYVTGPPTEVQLAKSMVKDIAGGTFKGFALLRSLAQQRAASPGGAACTAAWPYYVEGYGFVPPSQVGAGIGDPHHLASPKLPGGSTGLLSPTGVAGAWSQHSSPSSASSVASGQALLQDGIAQRAALAVVAAGAAFPLPSDEVGLLALSQGLQQEVAAQLLARGVAPSLADVSAHVARALELLAAAGQAALPGQQAYVTPRHTPSKHLPSANGSAALSHFYGQQQGPLGGSPLGAPPTPPGALLRPTVRSVLGLDDAAASPLTSALASPHTSPTLTPPYPGAFQLAPQSAELAQRGGGLSRTPSGTASSPLSPFAGPQGGILAGLPQGPGLPFASAVSQAGWGGSPILSPARAFGSPADSPTA